jgi:hypothetical protein
MPPEMRIPIDEARPGGSVLEYTMKWLTAPTRRA